MKRNTPWQVLALAAALAISLEARAQEEAPSVTRTAGGFGAVGQLAISSDFFGELGFRSGPGDDEFLITLRPAADYFLKENLSLGGHVTLATSLQDGNDPLAVGLGVRGGYNIPLTDTVSVWPKLGLAVGHVDAILTDRTYLEISLSAPFLIHFAPHFFVGGGPSLVTQLGDSTIATLSVSTVVGGYF
ncbi:MAG: hypothetical protein JXB05_13295 [Myxococcaceae bacterium]|nr:hypothetical protein [Myxococcaceae bacterium]